MYAHGQYMRLDGIHGVGDVAGVVGESSDRVGICIAPMAESPWASCRQGQLLFHMVTATVMQQCDWHSGSCPCHLQLQLQLFETRRRTLRSARCWGGSSGCGCVARWRRPPPRCASLPRARCFSAPTAAPTHRCVQAVQDQYQVAVSVFTYN
jgi:hypothetical protein